METTTIPMATETVSRINTDVTTYDITNAMETTSTVSMVTETSSQAKTDAMTTTSNSMATGTTTVPMETTTVPMATKTVSRINTVVTTDGITNAMETTSTVSMVTETTSQAKTDAMTTTSDSMSTAIVCTGGFVQCRNGGCEPFASLCEEAGIVTIATEVPVTISTMTMASPIVTEGQAVVVDTSSAMVTQTNKLTEVITTDALTNPVTVAVVNGDCKPGFVKCGDGRCEPYEHLCGNTGIVTIATEVPVTIATMLMTSPIVTEGHTIKVDTPNTMVTQTNIPTGSISGITDALAVTDTPTDGDCKLGFVKCGDGRCEPYGHLCGDSGIVTLPTVSTILTSALPPQATDISGASMVTDVTMSTGTAPTVPTTVATLPPLDNGCPPGHELCSDKTCEPFHFMCDEHLTGVLIGRKA